MTPSASISLSTRLRRRSALLGIEQRREGHRPLGQPGQQRRFGEREIFGVLGEEILRRSLEAVHAAAEVDLVAVEGEDLLLGEGALDLDGEIGLLNLAHGGAIGGEKEVARQLHGQRRCALGAPVRAYVVPGGAGHAKDVDAPVRLEVFVFDGDDGLAEDGREAVVADNLAALQGEGADDAAPAVVEIGGGGGAVLFELLNLGEVDGVDEGEAGERPGGGGKNDQRGQRGTAGELAAAVFGKRRTEGAARGLDGAGCGARCDGARFEARFGRRLMGGNSQGRFGLMGAVRLSVEEARSP